MTLALDASALIILDELDVLKSLCSLGLELVVPRLALDEVTSSKVRALAAAGLLKVVESEPALIPIEFRSGLGFGELAVLACCRQNKKYWAILDDLTSRRVASRIGLKFSGTASLLKFMEEREAVGGLSLQDVFRRMQELGFWIDRRTIAKVLSEPTPHFEE